MKRIRCIDSPGPVLLQTEKGTTAAEEASTCTALGCRVPVLQMKNGNNDETSACTSLDDSLSSGSSLNSARTAATTTCIIEPSMSRVPEAPEVTDDPSSAAKSKDRRVAFHHVHVKEFDRIIGDNPSCSYGVPISMGWSLLNEAEIDMEEYETFRNNSRRSKVQLILPKETREVLLMDWGCSTEDISKAVKEKIKIKNQRNFTVAKLGPIDSLEELMEKANRKMRKTFGRRKLLA